jgi:hypothetical protein
MEKQAEPDSLIKEIKSELKERRITLTALLLSVG